jgi:UDP-4-amino-4-deoxy-L-arabinose formyltransferase / UDP-glucuronic acid dehydrogenase (UDP-4-keto-hexauronic acid decarboxylating)
VEQVVKTIVFAYSEFGCIGIEELVASGYDIAAVFTYPEDKQDIGFYRSVAQMCIEHDIPAYTIEKDNEEARYAMMREIAPDFIFSFYYRALIPDVILQLAKRGAYNVHGSMLPNYRGRAPVNWVLVNGETQTGVTLHHMVARADAGDIVAQTPVDIAYDDTAYTLQRKLLNAAHTIFKTQFPLIAKGVAPRIKQDLSKGSYFGRRTPADGQIDWNKPAHLVRNLIRAVTHPYPGAFTLINGKKLFIWQADIDSASSATPGTVLSVSPLTVACGQGAIVVRSAQLEGGLVLSGKQLAAELHLADKRCI